MNIAGRATLTILTLATIPNDAMQFTLLPSKFFKEIDKLQRNFIWGTTDQKKKLHLLNWSTITTNKASGGLGMKKELGLAN